MLLNAVFYGVPGKVVTERPLVIRNINGKDFYWNYQQQRWIRFTKRCPYLV